MPEYPEIRCLAGQMDQALTGKVLAGADVANEKCLNLPADAFARSIAGRSVTGASARESGPLCRWTTAAGWRSI